MILSCGYGHAQHLIQGDQLLQLIGRPLPDPLYQQFLQQEGFTANNNYWNRDFTVYLNNDYSDQKKITEVQLLNGQKRYQSEERYGYYRRQLPLQLSWSMSRAACELLLGYPVRTWPSSPNVLDYARHGWLIRIEYENNLPIMMNFQLDPDHVRMGSSTAIKVDTSKGTVEINWPVLKKLIISSSKLQTLTNKDSVDYIGQVYYGTAYKTAGFLRTAIKRVKKTNEWFYESYMKPGSDSIKVRRLFLSLYNELKKVFKDSTGNDFTLVAIAEDPISKSPMNWLVSWNLFSAYKTLPPGIGNAKLSLMLTGMKDVFKNGAMDYTLKIYIADHHVKYDFWGWDDPK